MRLLSFLQLNQFLWINVSFKAGKVNYPLNFILLETAVFW